MWRVVGSGAGDYHCVKLLAVKVVVWLELGQKRARRGTQSSQMNVGCGADVKAGSTSE